MEDIVKFGLIGKNISYSFSEKYFTEKFRKLFLKNHIYHTFDLPSIDEIQNLLKDPTLKGFNVTIPYKEQIIPYLDELNEEAQYIQAVNTVLIKNGKRIGYNTDAFGFEQTLLLHKKETHTQALILGNGGAAKAVKFVLEKHKIPFRVVTRTSEPNFETLPKEWVVTSPIIIQCTPVGTFPNVKDCLHFPFEQLTHQHLVIDLIYNPNQTEFLLRAAQQGAKCCNGFFMLEQQAEKAWEIWNFK